MIEGIIGMLILLLLYIKLFTSTDTKRGLLNEVGLDLSPDAYNNGKAKEFSKHCLAAMQTAIIEHDVKGYDEYDFLKELRWVLLNSYSGKERYDPAYGYNDYDYIGEEKPFYNLNESPHYIRFSLEVVRRRLNEFAITYPPILIFPCDFSSKTDLKKYITTLWNKYQNPGPKDWMKMDKY